MTLTTVIFTVCATLSTFKGGGFSTRSVLAQTQASDQWAYYQAKSIKGYIYEIRKEKFELEVKGASPKMPRSVVEDYTQRIDSYSGKVKKYEEEKKQIEQKARKFEGVRDDAQRHAQIFGMAVIFLKIAILLSSIAALLKKKIVDARSLPWCSRVSLFYERLLPLYLD